MTEKLHRTIKDQRRTLGTVNKRIKKLEEENEALKGLVNMCHSQMNRISEMENLYNVRGIIKDIAWELEGEVK